MKPFNVLVSLDAAQLLGVARRTPDAAQLQIQCSPRRKSLTSRVPECGVSPGVLLSPHIYVVSSLVVSA